MVKNAPCQHTHLSLNSSCSQIVGVCLFFSLEQHSLTIQILSWLLASLLLEHGSIAEEIQRLLAALGYCVNSIPSEAQSGHHVDKRGFHLQQPAGDGRDEISQCQSEGERPFGTCSHPTISGHLSPGFLAA